MEKSKMIFLCSGEGSTFEYLSKLSWVEPLLLVTDRISCGAIDKARRLNVPFQVVSRKECSWDKVLIKTIQTFLENSKIDWIVLAGFLSRLSPDFLSKYPNQVINSHPSLLPLFGGKGMYGIHVHRAVVKSGNSKTGVTIHYVNEEYDQGKIIEQKEVQVLPDDTPESLEIRVKKVEKEFYAQVLKKLSIE